MTPHHDPEREEKKEGILGEVCESGLEIVDGVLDVTGSVFEATGSVLGGAVEIAGSAVEAVGSVAGEAASGCAGCAPVILLAFLLPIGLIGGHFLF